MHPSTLDKLDMSQSHDFFKPVKRIYDGPDVNFFLASMAYRDIMQFILQLNRAMLPRKLADREGAQPQIWQTTNDETTFSEPVLQLRKLIASLQAIISEAPPDPGPRRFGNVSFRKWHALVEERLSTLLAKQMSPEVCLAQSELELYLLGSFGSPQRLDYGTGHELSFMAFLGCLWKLNYFSQAKSGVEERSIVIGVFEPYLTLIRTLIKTYNLEPAGSHGVWGLDDNSFLPYVFGSAQLTTPINEDDDTPTQGSVPNAPDPASVVKANLVDKEKATNMYFSAIGFINEVKRGPFWEHSPILFDISGIKDGWGKINKGMLKMYHAEVLAKFPVVQHFPFGSLFKWERDPDAKVSPPTTHTSSQPLRNPLDSHAPAANRSSGMIQPSMVTPWAGGARLPTAPGGFVNGVTQAPWANSARGPPAARGGLRTQMQSRVGTRFPGTVESKQEGQ